ncbi:MAG: ERCC4 domain-containing protein [Nanoarchaeota archaeon]
MPFHDIFSSKREIKKENQSSTIIIDIHEKNSLIPAELSRLSIPFEFQNLPIGDYLINNIAIERKTFQDLQSSIISKRIFAQIKNLQQHTSPLLIIEGFSSLKEQLLHENALRGFFLSLALKDKIPFVFTENEKDTALYLSLLARKQTKKEISIRPSKIALTKKQQIQFILEGFPHVGPVRAKKLLEKFNSLKNIINASESELQEILEKRAKEFKELIDSLF